MQGCPASLGGRCDPLGFGFRVRRHASPGHRPAAHGHCGWQAGLGRTNDPLSGPLSAGSGDRVVTRATSVCLMSWHGFHAHRGRFLCHASPPEDDTVGRPWLPGHPGLIRRRLPPAYRDAIAGDPPGGHRLVQGRDADRATPQRPSKKNLPHPAARFPIQFDPEWRRLDQGGASCPRSAAYNAVFSDLEPGCGLADGKSAGDHSPCPLKLSGTTTGLRPPLRPRAAAATRPARVRSWIRSRSNCPRAPNR